MVWHRDCPDGRRLLDRYLMALTADDAVNQSARSGVATNQEVRDARDLLIAARNAYWRHVQRHKCRSAASDNP